MNLKIGLIGNEKIIQGFEISGLCKKDNTLFCFESDCDVEILKNAFFSLIQRTDVGLIFITENLSEILKNELNEHKKPIPTILKIPSRF